MNGQGVVLALFLMFYGFNLIGSIMMYKNKVTPSEYSKSKVALSFIIAGILMTGVIYLASN